MCEKKITKVLLKDKRIKELVKEGQDPVSVFASRLFNISVAECGPVVFEGTKPALRYNVAKALACAIANKDYGCLVENNVAGMLRELFEEKIIVEVPVKATTTAKKTSTSAKKPASKKTSK